MTKQNKKQKSQIDKPLDKANSVQPETPTKSSPYSFSFKQGMNFVRKGLSVAQQFYNEINPATLTGNTLFQLKVQLKYI